MDLTMKSSVVCETSPKTPLCIGAGFDRFAFCCGTGFSTTFLRNEGMSNRIAPQNNTAQPSTPEI